MRSSLMRSPLAGCNCQLGVVRCDNEEDKDALASIVDKADDFLQKIDAMASLNFMKHSINTVADLGLLLRAVRKSQGLRLDDLAGSAGVGHVFAREVEHGKETVQMGRVLRLLQELGLQLSVDIPSGALEQFEALKATGLKPLKPRAQRTVSKATKA